MIAEFTIPGEVVPAEEIDSWISLYNETASDTYLEGDAVVYKAGEQEYEFILENIVVTATKDSHKIFEQNSGPYWLDQSSRVSNIPPYV